VKILPFAASVLSLSACVFAASAAMAQDTQPTTTPVKNVVLVHGAWVDGSGWKPVYDILTKDGYHVTMVQEPLTSDYSGSAQLWRLDHHRSGCRSEGGRPGVCGRACTGSRRRRVRSG
jgi:hypothetical protein